MFNTKVLLARTPFSQRLIKHSYKPKPPPLEALDKTPSKLVYEYFPPKSDLPPHQRLAQPKKEKRYLTDVETGRPLPNTFKFGESEKDYKTKPLICEPLPKGEYHYPYRYYEICLRRGVLGLPKSTRHIVQSLGLHKRHQVVWRLVSPRSAGQILKIKELVHVRLVNEIPPKPEYPKGYQVVGSFLDQ
jgi:ribosomal protein L30/L7E